MVCRITRAIQKSRGSVVRWAWAGLLPAALIVSCAGLPQLKPVDGSFAQDAVAACRDVFTDADWRFVHAIETVISGSSASVMIGVTVISPGTREIEAVIMTLEGMVMFHARSSEGAIEIQRAVAPFDSPHFAEGLIEDVTLIFMPPLAVKTTAGFSSDGALTCRYFRNDASVVDVMPGANGSWQLFEYNRRSNLRRRVIAAERTNCPPAQETDLPCRIELQALQGPGYTLKMSLIEAERINE